MQIGGQHPQVVDIQAVTTIYLTMEKKLAIRPQSVIIKEC